MNVALKESPGCLKEVIMAQRMGNIVHTIKIIRMIKISVTPKGFLFPIPCAVIMYAPDYLSLLNLDIKVMARISSIMTNSQEIEEPLPSLNHFIPIRYE